MYAMVEISGQQFRVEKDKTIKTQKLAGEVGDNVTFEQVLLVGDGEQVRIGRPVVTGANVAGTIVDQFRDEKVIIFKKKRRKSYRRKNGHRQSLTKVRIDTITL